MTERLYYRDPALLEFDAVVIAHAGDAQHVVLDRTAFYPTSGGQPHDLGTLGFARVIDVIDDDVRIVHVVDADIPFGPVHGAIDAARRADHMQQHTAQHLLSALAADRFGWDTTSVHFGADRSSIEFATAGATAAQCEELEHRANDAVRQARPVTISFEDSAAASRAGLRKPSDRTGDVRVITIAGLDRSACGGTHVANTGAIGAVLLLGIERIRGQIRLGFLAGDRVLRHARERDRILGSIANATSCAIGELEALVPARQEELRALRDRIAKLEQEAAVARLRTLVAGTAPRSGLRRVLHRATDESAATLRAMAQATGAFEQVLFVAIADSPPTIYLGTSNDSGVDAGAKLKAALAAAGGRGGGSTRVAQGTVAAGNALEQVAAAVLEA